MKLRNIFLASLAVCTMASCSKDETIDYSQMGPVDAYVSLAATSAIQTKATVDKNGDELLSGEKYINSLTAYVFLDKGATDADKTFAAVKHLTVATNEEAALVSNETGLLGIDHIIVKVTPDASGTSSSDNFIAVLVANADQVTVSNLAELKNKVITKSVENYTPAVVAAKTCYLPMVSGEIKFGKLVPNIIVDGDQKTYTENWINSGSTTTISQTSTENDPTIIPTGLNKVTLTRLVARVQVESVTVKIVDNYPGARFKLEHLSLVNVRPTATIETGAGNYVKGYQSSGYGPSERAWIFDTNGSTVSTLVKAYNILLDEGGTPGSDVKKWGKEDTDKFCSYIFGNPEVTKENEATVYQTALLISGTFYKNKEDKTGSEKNFRVFLQDIETKGPIMVIPNNVYKLNVTVTGEGSPNENEILLNAHVAATIEVAPWNVIEQTEEDAN
ncbi:fimbrial protein [uncultured Parabacteroides sp.]|uniref:fimbrial protein n=1 Tax=uncultured Parabacteroides sp. TaxID=512312 RepID=UPI0025FC2BF2|nr:fimbrial protein [uncultured Parabacteroides sp.]